MINLSVDAPLQAHHTTRWSRFWNNPVLELLRATAHKDKRTIGAALFCSIMVALTSLSVGWAGKHVMDAMTVRNFTASNFARLNLFSLVIVGAYSLRWPFTYGQMVLFNEASQQFGLRLRARIYRHLQSLSLRYFNKQRTGALMSTMSNDVPIMQAMIAGLKDTAQGPFLIIGGICYIFYLSVPLSLLAILIFPIMGVTINYLNRRIKTITWDTQDKVSDVNTMMEETLSGIRVIQSFSSENAEMNRFERETRSAKELYMKSVRYQAKLKPTIDVIGAGGVALSLWVGGFLVIGHHLTIGGLTAFVATLNQIAVGISSVGNARTAWEQAQGAGARILTNVLTVESDIVDAPDAIDLPRTEGQIEFQNVSFSYNSDSPVLRDVSFRMNPGEVVAVVGASGAGKSTVSDLIPRFYDPDSGCVLIDGHDIRQVTLKSLRKHIGIVPQETVLFGGTIRDNIVYGDPAATDEMVENAARAANAHDFIMDPRILPNGYQTIVGERGKQLSGGQRQRIAIARALLKDPRILILDEATSSLDAASEILVQEALDELMQGRTTLVIAHRLSTIINANNILVMQSGRILEQGTHAELIRVPGGIYARLYETQFRWEADPQPLQDPQSGIEPREPVRELDTVTPA
jgi:subfamily B ATP-binding cassette protein MsbA